MTKKHLNFIDFAHKKLQVFIRNTLICNANLYNEGASLRTHSDPSDFIKL